MKNIHGTLSVSFEGNQLIRKHLSTKAIMLFVCQNMIKGLSDFNQAPGPSKVRELDRVDTIKYKWITF